MDIFFALLIFYSESLILLSLFSVFDLDFKGRDGCEKSEREIAKCDPPINQFLASSFMSACQKFRE